MSSLPHGRLALAAAISAPGPPCWTMIALPAWVRSVPDRWARAGSSQSSCSVTSLHLLAQGRVAAPEQRAEVAVLQEVRGPRPGRQIAADHLLHPGGRGLGGP